MTATPQQAYRASSRNNPCPICGRTKDGSCSISDSLLHCHFGKTHQPPELKVGETVEGEDHQIWAFTGNTSDGRAATFTLHKPREQHHSTSVVVPFPARDLPLSTRLARLPEPAEQPPEHWANGEDLLYSDHQKVVVEVGPDSKAHKPWHRPPGGEWIKRKAGPNHWPLWAEDDAIAHGRGHWIAEAEGEKCAEWFCAAGFVAVSQPGHAHTPPEIQRRYQRLKDASVEGIAYLSDNDPTGHQKASRCQKAANAIGLQFAWIKAEDVWPDLPPGGSIDDAQGSPANRVAAFQQALDRPRPPEQPDNTPETFRLSAWEQKKLEAIAKGGGDPAAIAFASWDLLLERSAEIVASQGSINRQRQAIKAVGDDLGLRVDNATLSEILEQCDTALEAYEPDVEPGGCFSAPAQSWLVHELFLVGLNLLVGMPGAGKSKLLVALVRAHLHGQQTFLQRKLLDGSKRHVLIVGTDQDRQQWASLLEEQGLATVVSTSTSEEGIELKEWRLHPQLRLKTSGGGFKLNAEGLREIRNWAKAHPGGLLIIDSLSAVLPPGVQEKDETVGRLMRQIETARQGNPCIVTHHTKKEAAINGQVGVYSGSGHGSIDRAVSRFIGLAYETHVEAGKEKLHEDSPRRVLTSQKRGAANQRLIVEMGPHGSWDYIGTAAEQRELRRQDQDGSAEDNLRGWKRRLYKACTDQWLTTSQVFDRLPLDAQKRDPQKKQVRDNLRYLADDGYLEQDKGSLVETRWRRRGQNDASPHETEN